VILKFKICPMKVLNVLFIRLKVVCAYSGCTISYEKKHKISPFLRERTLPLG